MGEICFWISWYGMRLKSKFGAIRGVVRGVVVFEWVLNENKTPDLMSCGIVILLLI